MNLRRVYLDNAATSWPKPPRVIEAMQRYLLENGAAAGRGVYREAIEAERLVQTARDRVAKLLHATSANRIIFTHNCTDALNLALFGLLRTGQRVLTSAVEHNSVLRPLRQLERERSLQITYLEGDEHGLLDPRELAAKLPDVDVVVLNHASNVTGAIQSLEEIAPLIQAARAKFILDAAQTAGVVEIDVQRLGIHLLATSGHKGLLGPLGTGLLYIAPGLESELTPLRFGGTGTRSDEEAQPLTMPDRFEAGNANVPGIVGLSEGVSYVLEETVERIGAREAALIDQLLTGLASLPGIRMLGPPAGVRRAAVVAFTVEGYASHEVATLLDANFGVQTRSGLHCAPRIHRQLGLLSSGTVRLSVGPFTTTEDIEIALQALGEVVAG